MTSRRHLVAAPSQSRHAAPRLDPRRRSIARHGRGQITLHLPEDWHREAEWMNLVSPRPHGRCYAVPLADRWLTITSSLTSIRHLNFVRCPLAQGNGRHSLGNGDGQRPNPGIAGVSGSDAWRSPMAARIDDDYMTAEYDGHVIATARTAGTR
jgi:hypothetical protein